MARLRIPALLLAATAASGAHAAATYFTGLLDLHAGYGSNPYLTGGDNGGSGLAGATLSGTLSSSTSRSTTALTGVADVQQSFSRYGRSENFTVSLSRSQQLSERFTINGDVSYSNTINPGVSYQNTLASGALFLPSPTLVDTTGTGAGAAAGATIGSAAAIATPVTTVPIGTFNTGNIDLFTIGQRSERYSGDLGLSWTATARDQFTLGGNASRVHYRRFNGNYDQYGGLFGYLRTISPRTRVGFNASATQIKSDNYPAAESYGFNLQLVQQINAHWTFNGSAGVFLPRGGVAGQNRDPSLGFNGSLCGDYERLNVCFTAARQAAPTGIGGLRTDLQAGFTLGYQLSERDQINGGATVDRSSGNALVPRQEYYQASAGYSRTLTRRISLGGSARYQHRSGFGGFFGAGSGYAVTVDVITRFGHVAQ